MHDLQRDIIHAFRLAVRNPQYSIIVVLTLALGIGGNAAVFTIVNAALLRPLPYERADRLVQVWNAMTRPVVREMTMAPADFVDLAARSRTVSELAAHNVWFPTVGDAASAERVTAGVVTANLFPMLGMQPLIGRNFEPQEDQPSGDRVLILSHGAWLRRFGGSADALGQTLLITGVPYQVIGVLPPEYRHPDPHEPLRDAEFFAPISYTRVAPPRESQFLRVIGRLRAGATIDQARAELSSIAQKLAVDHPETNQDRGITVVSLRDNFFSGLKQPLMMAQAGALLVLLIACANVANLALVRGHSRRREFAIRASIGAHRNRLARQLIVEHLVLVVAGTVLGLVCLIAGVGALRALGGRFIPIIASVAIDGTVIGFTLLLALLSTIVFGLVPLLELERGDLRGVLADETAGAGRTRRAQQIHRWLIGGEVALAVALVVGSAVLARSLMALGNVSPGFATQQVLTFQVTLPAATYPDSAPTSAFFRELRTRLAALPGVSTAALISDLPLTSENRSLDIRPLELSNESLVQTDMQAVSAGYFSAAGIPVLQGRSFIETDGRHAAIVSASLARQFWPGENAVGKQLYISRPEPVEVVGVVGDIIDQSLTSSLEPLLYLTTASQPQRRMTVVLRTTVPPLSPANAARAVVRDMDARAPVVDMRTMQDIVQEHLRQPRFTASVSSIFSLLALILAVLGIYGVLAYAVSTRTREIGIRAALGADHTKLGIMIVRQAMLFVLPGVGIGVLLGLGVTRGLSRFLFGVSALDPLSFAIAIVVLTMAALLASWIPARRAAGISPMRAIVG